MRNLSKKVKKCIAAAALAVSLNVGITAMAADVAVTPVQASFLTKANTVVYLTADLNTPTECILPENFPVSITGITSTGFWEIEINGVKFYIIGDAVKTDATATAPATQTVAQPQAQTPAKVTVGMKNAVKKAKSYLKHSDFSRKGLIDQLVYEGYTQEESIYGADNSGADWNSECLGQAKSYINHSSFSQKGLLNQLEYEGYTQSECIYGVNNCGADWNNECAEQAQSYLKHSSFSRQGLMDQLAYEGFTPEQIAYGIAAVGY